MTSRNPAKHFAGALSGSVSLLATSGRLALGLGLALSQGPESSAFAAELPGTAAESAGGYLEGPAPPAGQPAQPGQAAKPKAQANVLDFEGDVIEGQKKTPEIFLQTEVERPTLDTVLYQRRHFNDFHKNDSRQRPRASDPPR